MTDNSKQMTDLAALLERHPIPWKAALGKGPLTYDIIFVYDAKDRVVFTEKHWLADVCITRLWMWEAICALVNREPDVQRLRDTTEQRREAAAGAQEYLSVMGETSPFVTAHSDRLKTALDTMPQPPVCQRCNGAKRLTRWAVEGTHGEEVSLEMDELVNCPECGGTGKAKEMNGGAA